MFNLPDDWRGWVWQGGNTPNDLQDRYLTTAPLAPGDVLVQNAAIGLNPVDWKVLDSQIGKVPGVDGAGTVVAIGPEVDQRWLGTRVAYHQSLQRPGSFAEFTPIAAQVLMRVPDAIDFATAAAFPCPALTAWQAIEKVPVQPGAPLLIAGAGGSVGHFLVQLAQARGFEVTTQSSERHFSRLQALGAKHTLSDPRQNATRFYAVIDAISPEHAASLADLLLANGHLVCIQGRVEQWPCTPFGRALSLHEVALGALHLHGDAQQWHTLTQQGERMLAQITQGTLHSELLLHFPYDQLPAQLKALQHRNFSGKQIILL
ncbi:Alcohol dehydrogenase GroES [Pantoea sp. AS-PWVM4]|uniref:zinc-binding dehydrogenase n=1 Tax=Pantoea sp. AS-PWVM4 TaxID=1332069 RepID=UPI0003AC9DE1|nr:quinone oxidoreductase [Pantoea sp. AS-PWVM4]ERK05617.1 Alcohol dehydrogenase GroES [Pantoea sp. AS-PWVM4]